MDGCVFRLHIAGIRYGEDILCLRWNSCDLEKEAIAKNKQPKDHINISCVTRRLGREPNPTYLFSAKMYQWLEEWRWWNEGGVLTIVSRI